MANISNLSNWGSTFINFQGRKQGKSCFQLECQTNVKPLEYGVWSSVWKWKFAISVERVPDLEKEPKIRKSKLSCLIPRQKMKHFKLQTCITQKARQSKDWFFYTNFRSIKDLHFVKGSCGLAFWVTRFLLYFPIVQWQYIASPVAPV